MYIDSHLSWSKRIDKISKKVSSAIGALKRARKTLYITQSSILTVAAQFGMHTYAKTTKPSSSAHNEVKLRCQHLCSLISTYNNLYIRRKKLKAQFMFKILKGNMPSYL